MKIHYGVKGEFQPFAVRLDADGNEVSRRELAPLQDNLITNAGLDYLANGTMYWTYCHVGSGTTEPQFTDTRLANWKVSTREQYQSITVSGSTQQEMATSDVVWGSTTFYFKFNPGQAVGNITEIGLNETGGAESTLFTRALIKDEQGNPTAVTVQPGEYLYIAYTLRVYLDAKESDVQTFEWNGRTIRYRCGLYNCTNTGGTLIGDHMNQYPLMRSSNYAHRNHFRPATQAWPEDPATARTSGARSYIGGTVVSYAPYVNGSFKQTSILRWSPVDGNATFWGIQFDTGAMNYRIQFLDPLTKTNDYTLTLEIDQTWGRYSE